MQIASATGGQATVATVGSADSVEQLRSALGVGCTAAVLVEADPVALGPADVAREIAAVVRDHEAAGTSYDLVLLGNDAADSGDFQVGIRLAARAGPTGRDRHQDRRASSGGDARTCRATGRTGLETYAVPLPAVVTVMEGGVEPRYPTITGRMKAKKIEVETRATVAGSRRAAAGSGSRCRRPRPRPPRCSARDPGPPAAVVDLLQKLGVGTMIVVYVETTAEGVDEVSLETVTFARDLSAAGGGVPIDAVVVGPAPVERGRRARGVRRPHGAPRRLRRLRPVLRSGDRGSRGRGPAGRRARWS